MTLHCPHCLNNWPCNEPLVACLRRNLYIAKVLREGYGTPKVLRRNAGPRGNGATPGGTTTHQHVSFGYFWEDGYHDKSSDPYLWRKLAGRYERYFPHKKPKL